MRQFFAKVLRNAAFRMLLAFAAGAGLGRLGAPAELTNVVQQLAPAAAEAAADALEQK